MIDRPGLDSVEVTAADTDARIQVTLPQTLRVRLRGNPSTGYRWLLVDSGKPVLNSETDEGEFAPDGSGTGLMGAGGYEVWRFHPAAAGKTTLRFEYRRPWEHGIEPIEAVMYTIEVKPN